MTVSQLKDELKKLGLPVSGKKDELIARLEAASGGPAEAEPEEEAPPPPKKAAGSKKAAAAAAKPAAAEKAPAAKAAQEPKAEGKGAGKKAVGVGDVVSALYEEDQEWYDATVQRDYEDGTFLVSWHTDDSESSCKAENIKLKTKCTVNAAFQAGDSVEVLFDEDQTWYPSKVKRINQDGKYVIRWDADGGEYECSVDNIKPVQPKIPLVELKPGQQFKGRVGRSFPFGTFVDIGAERDGCLQPFGMYEGDSHSFQEGDAVMALFDEDQTEYAAKVKALNKDGTYLLEWDEGGEYTCAKDKMKLLRIAAIEEGAEVDVFVERVFVNAKGETKLGLVLHESKVGARPKLDVSAFASVPSSDWHEGTVKKVLEGIGAIVEFQCMGRRGSGLVHITRMKESFVQNVSDEVQVGQTVSVRIDRVDLAAGRINLSML